MLVELIRVHIVVVIETVIELRMAVVVLLPVMFSVMEWYMSSNGSSFTLLSSSCESIIVVSLLS